jgi:hypothetical protein
VDCDIEGDVFYPEINLNEWKEIKSENFKKDLDNDYDFVVRTTREPKKNSFEYSLF